MNEVRFRPTKRSLQQYRSRSSFRSSLRSHAITAPPIDWASLVLESLPQESPKNVGDLVWNKYKDDIWKKHKPDSRVLFELFRLVAKDPDTSDGMKLLSNVLAGFCVLDGYSASIEGLRDKGREQIVSAKNVTHPLRIPSA